MTERPILLNLVFEDSLSLAFMERLMEPYAESVIVRDRIDCHGFGRIKTNIVKYDRASAKVPFFVLTDLDRSACASELIAECLPSGPSEGFLFRIAVREVESWLLADRRGFADFLGTSIHNLPLKPDELDDPKLSLFSIVRRSRKRKLKESILPNPHARIGPEYNVVLPSFVRDLWNPETARTYSPSLDRAMRAIAKYAKHY